MVVWGTRLGEAPTSHPVPPAAAVSVLDARWQQPYLVSLYSWATQGKAKGSRGSRSGRQGGCHTTLELPNGTQSETAVEGRQGWVLGIDCMAWLGCQLLAVNLGPPLPTSAVLVQPLKAPELCGRLSGTCGSRMPGLFLYTMA